MSMALMVQAMNLKVGNPLRKLILIKLADNANDKGECWPSYQHIADQCETSRRSVIRIIKELQQQGFLKIEERKINGTLNKSNVYHLNLNGDTESLGGDTQSLGSDTGSLGGSDTVSPRTSHSLEPVKEPNNLSEARSLKILFDPITEKPNNVSLKCWQSWIDYKKAKKHTLTQKSWKAQREMLELHSDPETVIHNSIMNGWQGLFPNKTSRKSQVLIDHNQNGWYNENGY